MPRVISHSCTAGGGKRDGGSAQHVRGQPCRLDTGSTGGAAQRGAVMNVALTGVIRSPGPAGFSCIPIRRAFVRGARAGLW